MQGEVRRDGDGVLSTNDKGATVLVVLVVVVSGKEQVNVTSSRSRNTTSTALPSHRCRILRTLEGEAMVVM
jgi:hypothetical protein